jgi:hypothetical protein
MQLAQINIARMLAPIDSPVMADFVANLDRINALAEEANGFVWRLKDEENNATSIQAFEDEFIIVNMSVWENIDSLFEFAYRSDHLEIFKRKREWFENMKAPHLALWYVEDGHQPTPEEGKERLEYLQKHGETEYAFTFRKRF